MEMKNQYEIIEFKKKVELIFKKLPYSINKNYKIELIKIIFKFIIQLINNSLVNFIYNPFILIKK